MSHAAAAHLDWKPEGDFDFTNGKMAMWLLLVSDAMAFIGFLGAYMVLRIGSPTPVAEGSLAWTLTWAPPLDVFITGLNTFVLICSSVAMVKAFAAIQDGNQAGLKKWLLATIAGGLLFVGYQCYEWTHMIHEGVTMQGIIVPDLETAVERWERHEYDLVTNAEYEKLGAAKAREEHKISRLAIAETMFGGREIPADEAAKFSDGDFTEDEFLALDVVPMDEDNFDMRPRKPGLIHMASYGVPRTSGHASLAGEALLEQTHAERVEAGARVPSLFASSFFTLTGFHGLHVFLGVVYLFVLFIMAMRGRFTQSHNSTIEVAGLYWHFVDLVWVLLFMLIYLI